MAAQVAKRGTIWENWDEQGTRVHVAARADRDPMVGLYETKIELDKKAKKVQQLCMVRIKAFGSEPGAKEMAEQAMVKVGEAYLTGMQKDDLYKLRDSIVEIKNPSAATGVRKRNKNSVLCVFVVLVCFGFHFHPFQKRTSTKTIAVHFSSVPETAWPQTGLEITGHVFVSRVHPGVHPILF